LRVGIFQDNTTIRFGEDRWLGDLHLSQKCPSLYSIVKQKHATVVDGLNLTTLNACSRRAPPGDKWATWLHLV
jgi:hypothetical protein